MVAYDNGQSPLPHPTDGSAIADVDDINLQCGDVTRSAFKEIHPNLIKLVADVTTIERHGVTLDCCVPIWQVPDRERPQQIEHLVKLAVDPVVSLSESRNALLIAGILFGSSPYGEMVKLFVNQIGSSLFSGMQTLAKSVRELLAQDCAKGQQSRLLTKVLGNPADLSPRVQNHYGEKVLPELCLNLLYPITLLTGGNLTSQQVTQAYSAPAVDKHQKPQALLRVKQSFGSELEDISPEAILEFLSSQTDLLTLKGDRPGGQIFEAYYCAWILAAKKDRASNPLIVQH
jgi:hypothetical protein